MYSVKLFCFLLVVFAEVLFTFASVNMWVSKSETKSLLGIPREIFYIQEGIVNNYAMNFTIVIPANISTLHFNWESTSRKQVRYKIGVDLGDEAVVSGASFNVPLQGSVPRDPSVLTVTLPCRDRVVGSTEVRVTIVFTMPRDVLMGVKRSRETLTFRRKRVCRWPGLGEDYEKQPRSSDSQHRAQQDSPAHNPTGKARGDRFGPEMGSPKVDFDSSSVLYVAVGSTCGVVLAVTAVLAVVVTRSRASHQQKRHHRRYDDCVSGEQYTQMNTPSVYSCQSLHQYASLRPLPPIPPSSSQSTVTTPLSLGPTVGSGSALVYAAAPVVGLAGPVSERQSSRLASSCSVSSLSQRQETMVVERCRVCVDRCLSEANGSRVCTGWISDSESSEKERIIIKSVSERASSEEISSLLQDGLAFHGLRHKNLLSPLGVALDDCRSPLVLYPHVKHWNLKHYLQCSSYGTRSAAQQLSNNDVIDMAEQACLGLAFLHRQGIFHGDVAARNCSIDGSNCLKLTDHALSRDMFPDDYWCLADDLPRPVKWMAPEVLAGHTCSDMSDVWSFAVLLWELTTLARQPYTEVAATDMAATLRDGYRLAQPLNCHNALYSVMSFCWNYDASHRPTMTRIEEYLRGLQNNTRLH